MKAKYIINEIRQDMESGLSAVGVGKTVITKAYNYIKSTWPDQLKYFQIMSEVVSNRLDNDYIKKYILSTLNARFDQLIIADAKILNKSINKWMEYKISFKYDKTYEPDSITRMLNYKDNTYLIHTSNNLGLGYASIGYVNENNEWNLHEQYYYMRV